MANIKLNENDLRKSKRRAKEWIAFREKYCFSQTKLAETLGVGRRTIQAIESGEVKRPQADTLRRYMILKSKYDAGEYI